MPPHHRAQDLELAQKTKRPGEEFIPGSAEDQINSVEQIEAQEALTL